MKKIISHCCEWNLIPDSVVENFLAEFAWNGVEYLTFTEHQGFRFLREEDYFTSFRKQAEKYGILIHDIHAPCGMEYDLDIPDAVKHANLVAAHKKCIERFAGEGAKTYTLHIGAGPYVAGYEGRKPELEELRLWAIRTLEELRPTAEKNNMLLCVENSFEPPNAPEEVLYYVKYFNTSAIRCCYDAGHANFMSGLMGKEKKDISGYSQHHIERVWRGNLTLENHALEKMLPYMATCHLHDNDGYSDAHELAGSGTADWEYILPMLAEAPHLISIQNESRTAKHAIPIGKAAAEFREIGSKIN